MNVEHAPWITWQSGEQLQESSALEFADHWSGLEAECVAPWLFTPNMYLRAKEDGHVFVVADFYWHHMPTKKVVAGALTTSIHWDGDGKHIPSLGTIDGKVPWHDPAGNTLAVCAIHVSPMVERLRVSSDEVMRLLLLQLKERAQKQKMSHCIVSVPAGTTNIARVLTETTFVVSDDHAVTKIVTPEIFEMFQKWYKSDSWEQGEDGAWYCAGTAGFWMLHSQQAIYHEPRVWFELPIDAK